MASTGDSARYPETLGEGPAEGTDASTADVFVAVAVPAPLPEALTYAVPPTLAEGLGPGFRVRVPLGRRQVVGVVTARLDAPPDGVRTKAILEVLDVEPVLDGEMLDLAAFVAEYYMAPIGESVRLLVPGTLPPWGERRISLTDAGALAEPRDELDTAIRDYLLNHSKVRLGELRAELGLPLVAPRIAELARAGRVSVEERGGGRGTRFVKAVERSPGDLAEQLKACGRSPKAKSVLEYLDALGRPATLRDIGQQVGCTSAVVRRLSKLGLVREFTQPETLSLRRHRLETSTEAETGDPGIVLRPDQETCASAIEGGIRQGSFTPFLLRGMTGSGKTEVYLRAARLCLDLGRGVVLMVPEIALVPALATDVRKRFGREMAILHSNLSKAERHQEWERIRRGEARVVLGPRSALLAPVRHLGLIVVDEEHDSSYKQDKSPRYNGRDLALWRAKAHGAVAVLVSATPSLESRYNANTGKLAPLVLTQRAGHGGLPQGLLVDLRKEPAARQSGEVLFSGLLLKEIRDAADRGGQVILLRNRRGYSPVLLCRACGEDFRCGDCGLPMTYHLRGHRLACHYCGADQRAPTSCSTCGEAALEPMGAGTERVGERFRELFPDLAVDVLDADASRRVGGAAAVLERFRTGETRVLVGTQMVSKGHHFPNVSLAAVLSADTYLRFPDFRAVERTYALLTQLAGRAGRGERPGKVVIQTYYPDHYAIRAALANDDGAFIEQEMEFRRTYHYPPFTRAIQVLAQHKDIDRARTVLGRLARDVLRLPAARTLRVLGPTSAPLERLRGRWRVQMLLRAASASLLRRTLWAALGSVPAADRSILSIDVDPYDLM